MNTEFNISLLPWQQTVWEDLCDEMFNIQSVDYIKALTLYEMYKLWNKRDNPAASPLKKGKFYMCVERWLVKTGAYHQTKQKTQWQQLNKVSSADVFKKLRVGSHLKDNDDDFIETDVNKRVTLI